MSPSQSREAEYQHAREMFFMCGGILLGGVIALSTWWIAVAFGVWGIFYAGVLLWKAGTR